MTVYEFTKDLWINTQEPSARMTLEEAKVDIDNFSGMDDIEMPEDITPEEYMKVWNELVFEQNKTWFLIDDCKSKGQIFEEDLDTQDKEEALEYARHEWDKLSDRDKKLRNEYYIALALPDENGNPDYDTVADIAHIK